METILETTLGLGLRLTGGPCAEKQRDATPESGDAPPAPFGDCAARG
jgi:hypothetical protein